MQAKILGQKAVVLGGSMAGLLAARVLSDYFAQVVLVERDNFNPEMTPRKGVPQGRHAHGLLARGLNIINELFPGIREELIKNGAVAVDMGANLYCHIFGGYKVRFPSEFIAISMSRPFLETHVRQQVLAIRNLEVLDETDITGYVTSPDQKQLTGVTIEGRRPGDKPQTITADLVVDATGRGTKTPAWLAQLGFGEVPESEVKMNVGYSTRLYHCAPNDPDKDKVFMILPNVPHNNRLGIAMPIDGNRWIITLSGWGADYPPHDEKGFLEYARSLTTPDIFNLINRLQPAGDITVHRLPSNLRRHYEKMNKLPEGLVVLGDAVCSFNPVYGQGITTASLQALVLRDVLQTQKEGVVGLNRRHFKQVVTVLDMPWSMATGEDFRFPTTTGPKPFGADLLNAYTAYVHRATHQDPEVQRAFLGAMNMITSPFALFKPHIVWRVIKANLSRKKSQPAAVEPSAPALSTR